MQMKTEENHSYLTVITIDKPLEEMLFMLCFFDRRRHVLYCTSVHLDGQVSLTFCDVRRSTRLLRTSQ